MLMLTLVGIVTMSVLVFGLKMKSSIYVYFLESISIAGILKIIIDIFVLMATTNAVNLTDGIDGLSTGVTTLIIATLTIISIMWNIKETTIFGSIIMGTSLGFLLFNIYPAHVFMGDTGSLLLGGAIAGITLYLKIPLLLLIIAIIPIAETLSVILQVLYYKKTKKRLFKMSPIHHHFELCGWKETTVVIVFCAVTLVACGIGLLII